MQVVTRDDRLRSTQAQDALEAVEADLPAYPVENARSKRLKEAEKPERAVKVSTGAPTAGTENGPKLYAMRLLRSTEDVHASQRPCDASVRL